MLDSFPCFRPVTITMETDEVTSVCPKTGQPDWYTVRIQYRPLDAAIESKSLKLYLQEFRNRGVFCEALAAEILDEVVNSISPEFCTVTVTQKPRGGVTIVSEIHYDSADAVGVDEDTEAAAAGATPPHNQQHTEDA